LFGDLGSLHAKRATRRFGQMSDYPLPFRGSSGSFNVLFWQRFAWHLANDLRFIAFGAGGLVAGWFMFSLPI
jgi:hypothetical protein